MSNRILISGCIVSLIVWSQADVAVAQQKSAAANSYYGRIALVGKLDEPDGLCIDIPGTPEMPFIEWPAWVHTCKPGVISDMEFHFDATAPGAIMSTLVEPAVCIAADEQTVGAELHFKECVASDANQTFEYLDNGQLQLAATAENDATLCLAARTAARLSFGTPPTEDDPRGHSRVVNFERSHYARPLELRDCSIVSLEVSQWEAYVERPLNPFTPAN